MGGRSNSTTFQRIYLGLDWEKRFFWGMGINLRGCFLGGMGERRLFISQGRKVGFFLFFKELFLWWWGGWKRWVYIFFSFFLS
jgi:hypothetical protein